MKSLGASLLLLAVSLGATAASFTPGNVVVYRIGTGANALAAVGHAVFLDEFTPAGAPVQSLPMPTATAAPHFALNASGTAVTDGLLTRSVGGDCLAVPGYGRTLLAGTGNIAGTGTLDGTNPIPRVVGRVLGNGAIDTTTALTDVAFQSNMRSAATVDCAGFWVSGVSTAQTATGGVHYATLGSTTTTSLSTLPLSNSRGLAIAGGQLYVSGDVAELSGIGSVGAGLPTTGTQSVPVLSGITATNSPDTHAFVLLDLDSNVPGPDVLYIADEGSAGLTKFALVAGTWTAKGTVGTASDDYRGIAASVAPDGVTVTIYATRTGGGSVLVKIVDASGPAGTLSGTPTVIATAGTNTVFRGVALAPAVTVTLAAGPNAHVTPSTPQVIQAGTDVVFTPTADAGYQLVIGGTCSVVPNGPGSYRVSGPVLNCTVSVTATLQPTFTVTATADAHSSITPSGPQTVIGGTQAVFTVGADPNYVLSIGGTCAGTLLGNQYTTAAVNANCTVEATSVLVQYTVGISPKSLAHGTPVNGGPRMVPHGGTTSFTFTVDPGYKPVIRGNCGGSLAGLTYTTGPVTHDCIATVNFAQKALLFVGNSYTFGRVDPVMSFNTENVTDLTYEMWLANSTNSNPDEPHPWGGIPGIVKRLLDQAGFDWDVSISARNAASLKGHYLNSNPDGWDLRGNIASQKFDAVVLQDLSDEPLPFVRGENANLPYFNAYANKLEQWIHAGAAETFRETDLFGGGNTAACQAATGATATACDRVWVVTPPNANASAATDVYLYQTWARPDMIGPNGTNVNGQYYNATEGLEAMTADLRDAYVGRAATNPGFKAVNPVGDAFLRAVTEGFAMRDPYAPEPNKINLWHTDYFHPSKYGSYLSALVHFAMLTGTDPTTLGVETAGLDLGIAPDQILDLQVVARAAVAPKAPVIGVAAAGDGQVTVNFTAPQNVGGLPILDYTAVCGPQQATGTGSPLVVTGLANGVLVTCRVIARNSVTQGAFSALSNGVKPSNGTPTVRGPRDLNGDGKSDLVFQDATGNIAAWTMNGVALVNASGLLPAGSGWSVTHIADFNGDGKADLLLRHADGRVLMWIMNGLSVSAQVPLQPAGSGWTVTHAADMNGDGKADLLWEHTDGTVFAWLMDGGTFLGAAQLQPAGSGWHITHMADLNGDGRADILWQHSDGTTVGWLMDGLTYLSSAGFTPAGSGWSITQTGDVNGDGKQDLVWRNTSGAMMLWVMNGVGLDSFAALQLAGSPWRIDLVGDLDGDGKADLVWRNTSDGSTYATLMNGTATSSAGYLMGGASGWTATHLLDLNGDGKRDILWRYTDGTLATWIMNGLQPIDAAGLIGPSTWQVVPPAP